VPYNNRRPLVVDYAADISVLYLLGIVIVYILFFNPINAVTPVDYLLLPGCAPGVLARCKTTLTHERTPVDQTQMDSITFAHAVNLRKSSRSTNINSAPINSGFIAA
jgi:hypothetical protein